MFDFVGCFVGVLLGLDDGVFVGLEDGDDVGGVVGLIKGAIDGEFVGPCEGVADGLDVGWTGEVDGLFVGAFVAAKMSTKFKFVPICDAVVPMLVVAPEPSFPNEPDPIHFMLPSTNIAQVTEFNSLRDEICKDPVPKLMTGMLAKVVRAVLPR